MNWYIKAWKQYADFTGRARRKEYWMFVLFNMIVGTVLMGLDILFGITEEKLLGFGPLYFVYLLASFLPGLGVMVRRLHDIGKSGWMFLVLFIPVVGSIWFLVLLAQEGTRGENQYGPDPKETNQRFSDGYQDHALQDGTIPADDPKPGTFEATKKRTYIVNQVSETPYHQAENTFAGFLVSFSRVETGEYWELREGNNTIGSSDENDIMLQEKHVSGTHAKINISRDLQNDSWKFQLADLASSNGTELNGDRLPIYSGVEIKKQDVVKIGEYQLMLFVADKFAHKLALSGEFLGTTQSNYDSRDNFS